MQTINPSTGEVLERYTPISISEVEERIQAVHDALPAWAHTSFEERSRILMGLGESLESKRRELARLMAIEMGKPIVQGLAEIDKCTLACRYYAGHGPRMLEEEVIDTELGCSRICFDPLGIVFGIMPWNFPFWQVIRYAIPALMAGNGILLKHAPNVQGCALEIAALMAESELPAGLFQLLPIEEDRVPMVIQHPFVSAVTLTGSTRAGAAVAELAGKALKKTVLELGGSDPFIVLDDADLSLAVETAVKARLLNTGQSCIAAKRFILSKSIAEAFVDRLLNELQDLTYGDPLLEDTVLGPMARSDLRDGLHQQVLGSLAMGATLQLGGEVPQGPGFFYPPTVLTDVKAEMPVFAEETFGPVFSLVTAADDEEAIQLANHSHYGLGGSLWSEDTGKAMRLARCIQTGSVFINGMTVSHVALPFGGIGRSGYGRELSHYGIKEFTNIKTITVPSRG